MLARFLTLIIFIAVFFIPGKWLWSYFKTKYDVNNASITALNEVEELSQSELELPFEATTDFSSNKEKPDLERDTISENTNNTITSSEQRESRIPAAEDYAANRTLLPSLVTPSQNTNSTVSSRPPIDLLPQKQEQKPLTKKEATSVEKTTVEAKDEDYSSYSLETAFNAYNDLQKEASAITSGELEPQQNNLSAQISEVALNSSKELQEEATAYFIATQQNTTTSNVVVNEPGSTPAEYIIATIPSTHEGINYELNRIAPNFYDEGRSLRVYWKIKNETSSEIMLTPQLKRDLSPTKLSLVDFKNNRRLSIRYDRDLPQANCNLAQSIKPYGRIECSALLGPIFESNPNLNDSKVLVFMPGVKEGVRIFLNV